MLVFNIKYRLADSVRYKYPFIVSTIMAIACMGYIPMARLLVLLLGAILLMVGFAGFGYLTNDWADIEKDRLAQKPNTLTQTPTWGRMLALFTFILMLILPWYLLPFSCLTAEFAVLEVLLFCIYAFPPLRLKERGVWGLWCDAGYAHVVPALFATYTFSLASLKAIPHLWLYYLLLGTWQVVVGIRNILLHQLEDMEPDQVAGVETYLISQGKKPATEKALSQFYIPAEMGCLFLVLFFWGWKIHWLMALAYPTFLLWRIFSHAPRVSPQNYRQWFYAYADPFYHQWLPCMVSAAYLIKTVVGIMFVG